MLYKVLALICVAFFYGIYFAKMIVQRRRGIETNQMAKGKNKDRSYYVEFLLKIVTYIVPLVEVCSIYFVDCNLVNKILGLYLVVLGDGIFAIAIITMRDSWRAGIAGEDKKERHLVTGGIYRFSRNPAFLGFDLVYIGILIMFFNIILFVFSLAAVVLMHLQILSEEEYLEREYGESYRAYKSNTSRYAGLGKISLLNASIYLYAILFIWSVFYFVTCAYYGGITLSWLWLWPAVAIFSFIRIRMLFKEVKGKSKIPKFILLIYRAAWCAAVAIFIFVESNIIQEMTAKPQNNLDYVVVLGAGVHGTVPTNPLRVRIEKAYEYMLSNENTILIASGGKGFGEDISEAECIRDSLIEMGIDSNRIIMESNSTSTEENLKYSLSLIGKENASVGIITNGFHEYRANLIAKDVGYENVFSVPAITLFPVGIHYTVREFFGVMQYIVLGN